MQTAHLLPDGTVLEQYAVSFPGAALRGNNDMLLLESARPLTVLASTVTGGGIGRRSALLSLRVPRNFDCGNPAALVRAAARRLGLGGVTGFLTALDLRRAAVLEDARSGVLVVVTAGAGNATTPGRSAIASATPGTINVMALIDARLPIAALVTTAAVITEAKTLALLEAGVRLADGAPATGTSTDALAVGCTGTGRYHPYAGPVTPLGSAVGALVTRAVTMSLAGGNVAQLATPAAPAERSAGASHIAAVNT